MKRPFDVATCEAAIRVLEKIKRPSAREIERLQDWKKELSAALDSQQKPTPTEDTV